jgi:hypothetical protein
MPRENLELKNLIKARLELKYTKILFSQIPKELIECLKHILSLNFDDRPNYKFIRESLQLALMKEIGGLGPLGGSSDRRIDEELIESLQFEWD